SSYLIEAGKEEFAFFDFAPVGLVMVAIGILFTITIGKKLIPQRKSNDEESLFDIEDYLSEIVVGKDSKMRGKPLREFHTTYNLGVDILSILRNKQKIIAPDADEYLWEGDVLIVKAESKELTELVKRTGLSLKGAKIEESDSPSMLNSSNIALVEVVLRDDSFLIGRTALETKLRNRYNVNLVSKAVLPIKNESSLKTTSTNAILLEFNIDGESDSSI